MDNGINLIDTSNIYGLGHNEQLVGRAIAGRRDEVVLATKFGGRSGPDGNLMPGQGRWDSVRKALAESLDRLKVDHVDLYYYHRVDPTTKIEETVGAMASLVDEGKVKHIGLSEVTPDQIRRASKIHTIAAVQMEYSMFTRDVEVKLLPTIQELSIGLVAYSPLGRGLLVVNPTNPDSNDWRRNNPRFQGDNLDKNKQLVAQLGEIASKKHCTTSQLALAWLLHQSPAIVPIPGSRSREHVLENIKAASLKLSRGDLADIESVLKLNPPSGARGNAQYLANVEAGAKS